jgi:type VI protein secretion system component VasF
MNESFAESVGRVILGVTGLESQLRQHSGSLTVDTVRDQLIRLIDAFAREGRRAPGREDDYDLARCALVCWIDELFTVHAQWDHAAKKAFRDRCLERHYPELHHIRGRKPPEFPPPLEAPTLFYEMSELSKQRPEADALETYYLCAALGFEGALHDDDEARRAWFESAWAHIRERQPPDSVTGPNLSPSQLQPLTGARFRLGVATLVAVSALLTLLTFILAVHRKPY